MSKRLLAALIVVGAVAAVGAVVLGLSAITRPAAPTAPGQVASSQSPIPSQSSVSTPVPVAGNSRNIQMQESGPVAVQVMFVPQLGTGSLTFEVSMNTHSVELADLDLAKLGQVTLEPGGALADLTWAPAGGGAGHHVSGVLTAGDPNGLLAGAKRVTLELTGFPGGSPLRFQWPVSY